MRPYYKKTWTCTIIIVLFVLIFYTFSFAQTESIKGVQFKDGSIIYGRVTEMNIYDIRIETQDGKIITRKFDDVANFIKDTSVDSKQEIKQAPVAESILPTEVQKIQLAQERPEIAREVVIPDGTEIFVVTTETISSKTEVTGTVIRFEVYEDLVVDGVAVIKEGAIVKGSVCASRRAKRGGLGGSLKISIESTSTVDNQPIKLRTVKSQGGKNRIGAVIGTGFLIGPFALLKRGTDAEIIKGTKFQVYTDERKIVHVGDKPSAIKQDIEKDKKPDLYNELIKLKELKDKGVLSEEEFEFQKKKTLERY